MRCPKCQTDVPDGHFYCPNCRVSIYGYVSEDWKSNGGKLERAGRRLLDLLLLLALIGGGVVLARAIKWKELLNNFNSSAEVSPSTKPAQSPPSHSTKRRTGTSPNSSRESSEKASQATPVEGTDNPKQKTEEPSSASKPQSTSKPSATPPKPELP